MASWIAYRFELSAQIGSFSFPDLLQFACNFSVSGIPTANIVVPVGRSVRTGQPATIHKAWGQIKTRMPAKVYLKMTKISSDGSARAENEVAGKTLIFDGFAVGLGWRRSVTGAQVSIFLEHWLSDLNYSSALSATSHPGNPNDFTYPSVFENHGIDGTGAGGSGLPDWVPTIGSKESITVDMATDDFWGTILRPWMEAVCNDDPIDEQLANNKESKGNTAALAALKRMNGRGMKLNITCDDAQSVATGIQESLSQDTWQSWSNTTLWGKLLNDWCPAYWFAIIPRVNDALVVPVAGGTRKTHKTIYPNEYMSCDVTAQLTKMLGNVVIVHPVLSHTGAVMRDGDDALPDGNSGVAALWPKSTQNNGVKLIRQAPRWLSDPVFDYLSVSDTTGVENAAVGNAMEAPPSAKTPKHKPNKAQKAFRTVLERLCHQWYVNESLQGRYAELSGKLRFDICPGSSVKVLGAGEKFMVNDTTGEAVYGTVMAVTHVINTEVQRAATNFSLVHIRNEQENGDDRYSTDTPPLYNEAWIGDKFL